MKTMVIGLGQCGGRLADEFVRLDLRARDFRSVNVITRTIAVDTDANSMQGLSSNRPGNLKILIGEGKTRGHGVAKQRELAAQITAEEDFKVINEIKDSGRLETTDAFLVAGGIAGGTASGGLPVIARTLKEKYNRPVFALIVLPFEHELEIDANFAGNTTQCLEEIRSIADASFIFDNQRYIRKGVSWRENIAEINRMIVEPFFNLFCAGEEKKSEHVGVSTLEINDILQMLAGWTAIGYGKVDLPIIPMPWDKKGDRANHGITAMEAALSDLSIQCDPAKAAKALYLLSAPEKQIGVVLVTQLGELVRKLAPAATLRYGDYPIDKALLDVTVVLSGLSEIERLAAYRSIII
jgi:tubulin-like protein CetZ